MKLKKTKLLFVIFFTAHFGYCQIQDKDLQKANQAYERLSFVKAGKLYQRIVNKGYTTAIVLARLGDCYYFNSDYASASLWYAKLMMAEKNTIDADYDYRYAQTLRSLKKYEQAAVVLKKYYLKAGKLDQSESWRPENYSKEIKDQSGRYDLKELGVNSSFSDFGSAFYGKDKLLYASARETGVIIKRKHSWNDRAFLKIYSATITAEGDLVTPVLLEGNINSKYHQSTPILTKDGKTMYFTRSNYSKGKIGRDKKQGINYLKIYKAQNIDGQWKNIVELPYPINSDGFSSGHPALSPDDKELYFVSDRNNKMGNSDLYVVGINNKGGLENNLKPLGQEINTPGRESFPYVDGSGILYFSSDGHPGLGGLDVFAAVKDQNGIYNLVNLGEEINSAADDFCYIIDKDSNRGYFTSNRSGNDDLYGFIQKKPIKFPFTINPIVFGTVKDSILKSFVADVMIEIYDANNKKEGVYYTDSKGEYNIPLDAYKNYVLVFKKRGLIEKIIRIACLKPLEKSEQSPVLYNEMQLITDNKVIQLNEGDDLTRKLKLDPIYFDYQGAQIRKSSKAELNKIIAFLKERPSICIKVNSYTDSRGRDDFNKKLSIKRAKATVDYIINSGIAADRITGEGFGESHLINRCANGIYCTEKEHELNRRSEFIILLKNNIKEH